MLDHLKSLGLRANLQKCLAAKSANNLFGGGLEFSHDAGMSVPHTCRVITDLSESIQDRSRSPCRFMPQTVGPDGGSVPCGSVGPVPHAALSVVDQEPEYFTSLSPAPQNYSNPQGLPCPEPMDEAPFPSERGPAGVILSSQDDCDGRVPDGLGGGHQGRPVRGVLHRSRQINRLELMAVFLALKQFLPQLKVAMF